jgi:L-2-hydroxyglutarate oxidase LhgO
MSKKYDVLIVGAGVVGLSTGIALLQNRPSLKVIIAEKEKDLGLHASGRNSGVIHAGFYYSPDSLKASNLENWQRNTESLSKTSGKSSLLETKMKTHD